MFDPVTVSATAALTQGVAFLYGQITELLRRHRERGERAAEERDDAGTSTASGPDGAADVVTLPAVPAGVLDGSLSARSVSTAELDQNEEQLTSLRHALADYADGLARVRADDQTLAQTVAHARGLLETLYQQFVTLSGETGRPATGTPLTQEQLAERSASISASGAGAIAAETISGPAATSGGVAAGHSITGNITTGPGQAG
jgi:hypothetical protein